MHNPAQIIVEKTLRIPKAILHRLGKAYVTAICKREYEDQKFTRVNERPIEYRFVFHHLARLHPKTVLDVGTGTTALPHLIRHCGFLVTSIDNTHDYWSEGMFNRSFYVIKDDITATKLSSRFDFITCVSVLEHIHKADEAVASLFRLLRPGGHVVITCPYKEARHIENVYTMEGASYGQDLPYICRMYSRQDVNRWLDTHHGRLVDQEFWQVWTGDLWTFGELVTPPRPVSASVNHQLTCILLQKT